MVAAKMEQRKKAASATRFIGPIRLIGPVRLRQRSDKLQWRRCYAFRFGPLFDAGAARACASALFASAVLPRARYSVARCRQAGPKLGIIWTACSNALTASA